MNIILIENDWAPEDPFTDPRVAHVRQPCRAWPEQYEGRLIDRRLSYFRYRYGAAFLGLGNARDEAVRGRPGKWRTVSRDDDGMFDSPRQRNEVFAELLDSLTAGDWISEVQP